MSTLPKYPEWSAKLEAAREVRMAEMVAALRTECGVITRAAKRLNISRQRVTRLMKEFALVEMARDLREQAGGAESGRGRPPF